jgi:stage IV sporulation protein FB
LIVVRWMFCMNYCLVLINLIPAAPFDGGRILRSLLRLSLPKLDNEAISHSVKITGRIVGVALIAVAIGLGQGDQRGLFPAWFPLTVLGVIALFAAESSSAALLPPPKRPFRPPIDEDDDFSEESDSNSNLPGAEEVEWEDGPFAQWLEEKRELERNRRQELKQGELADERRVDEILARLHERGPQALSNEDRQVLQRVSDRLRRRQQKKA